MQAREQILHSHDWRFARGWVEYLFVTRAEYGKAYSQPHFMIGEAIDINPIAEPSLFLALPGFVTNGFCMQ